MRLLPAVAVLGLAALLSGCLDGFFGESRSDWAYASSQLDAVSDLGRGGSGVTVAILDTGINVGHPSLDHLLDGDRSNGEVMAFRDFLGDASEPEAAFDEDGHGSHVAGIISARGGSGGWGGIDLLGGAPRVLLVVARVCDGDACDGTVIDDAVRWSVSQGADVISMSLGGDAGANLLGVNPPSPVDSAVNDAIDRGVVVIASAGNAGPNNADVEFPANIPGVIAVGATDRDGQIAAFSSRGDDASNPCRRLPPPLPSSGRCAPDQKPEVVAPGVGIISAWTGNGFAGASGTSQATPFVTAAVALLIEGRSLSNREDVAAVKQALVGSASPAPGQVEPHDEAAGYGRLRARDALRTYAGL